jgi:hypothetical protein
MVVLNVIIVVVIVRAASVPSFLPERLKDSGWAIAVRGAWIALLLLVPALIGIRETQRARIPFKGTTGLHRVPQASVGAGSGSGRSTWLRKFAAAQGGLLLLPILLDTG